MQKFSSADKFANLWKMIAKRFGSQPNILGYNIINEPWAGNVYKVSHLEYSFFFFFTYFENLFKLKLRRPDCNAVAQQEIGVEAAQVLFAIFPFQQADLFALQASKKWRS